MHTGSPPISRVITMVLFALSCLGLLLFLWVSFGGTVPLGAQGYRVNVSFPNAQDLASQSDVRIAGVSVGKVVSTRLDPKGNRLVWLDEGTVNKLGALRGPGESLQPRHLSAGCRARRGPPDQRASTRRRR